MTTPAIYDNSVRIGVAQHAGECGLESFYVSGHGRADGRGKAGRRS